jgi:hypothetical protein
VLGDKVNFIDEIDTDLRRLIEHDFGPLSSAPLTDRQVLDWLHYRARLIPRRPRQVKVSQQVAAQIANYPTISRLKELFRTGGDVSPWLSDRVRKRKDDPFADLMFNDWQISHFHLGNVFVSQDKVGPRPKGEMLLFALVKAEHVTFIDLHQHGAWTAQQILRVLLQTSPKDIPEMKGILATQRGGYTDEELLLLRKSGMTAPLQLDGKFFLPPGCGLSSSGHATRLAQAFQNLKKNVYDLRLRVKQNALPLKLLRQMAIVTFIPPRLGIKLRDDGCLHLYEKNRALDLFVAPPLA